MCHRILTIVAGLFSGAVCLTGCFTIEKAEIKNIAGEHVLASNYGWYLFHFIPLACGNASSNAWTPWVAFRDDVTMDKIQGRFMRYAKGSGYAVEDLAYTTRESVMLEIPGINLPLPVPYLLTYREIQLSGVLLPPSYAEARAASAREPANAKEASR